MALLLNDCSIAGQFSSADEFELSISRIMELRQLASRLGWSVHCHPSVLASNVTADMNMRQVVGRLSIDRQRALLQWFTKAGPFWNEHPNHQPDDYVECNGEVVTETAVAEAGISVNRGLDYRLLSLTPSAWQFDPVKVELVDDVDRRTFATVPNYWRSDSLKTALAAAILPIASWGDLESRCLSDFENIRFVDSAFVALSSCPFSVAAGNRFIALLQVLDELAGCINADGSRNVEGQRIYDTYFHGDRAWFTDSSGTEKREMGDRLMFPHPDRKGEYIDCPWHGKVSTQYMRLHFAWPSLTDGEVLVTYLGPKLTKR